MTTLLLLLASCAFGLGCAMQSSRPARGSSDLREICQRTLDLDALDRFFHVDKLPERKPLFVLKSDVLPEEIPLTKFGENVKYVTREELQVRSRPYFEFRRISISGNQGNVEFAYPAEGVGGTVTLQRQGSSWTVTNVKIVER